MVLLFSVAILFTSVPKTRAHGTNHITHFLPTLSMFLFQFCRCQAKLQLADLGQRVYHRRGRGLSINQRVHLDVPVLHVVPFLLSKMFVMRRDVCCHVYYYCHCFFFFPAMCVSVCVSQATREILPACSDNKSITLYIPYYTKTSVCHEMRVVWTHILFGERKNTWQLMSGSMDKPLLVHTTFIYATVTKNKNLFL